MRKLYLVLAALTLSVAMLVAAITPAVAGEPETANGSVITDLLKWNPPDASHPYPTGWTSPPKVGSVILNTTESGQLNVLVNVDSLPDLVDWDVKVFAVDLYGHWAVQMFDNVLDTNNQGNGNVMVKLDISTFEGDEIGVLFGISYEYNTTGYGVWAGGAWVPLK